MEKRARLFFDALTKEDYDGILALTYPGIFNLVPKGLMREKIAETFLSDDSKVTMDLFEINAIGKVYEHDEGNYAVIHYTMLMAIQFLDKKADPEKEKEFREFMLRFFKSQFGEDNFWHEPHTDAYSYYQKKTMIGIQDQLSPEWTFINNQPGQLMEQFIPADIRMLIEWELSGQ